MRTIYIDCAGVSSPTELWQRYVEAAEPEGAALFGRNLDAFWDAVEHGGPGWPGTAKLIFTRSVELNGLQLASGASLLDGLRQVAEEATQTRIELA
jgi:Barstar (barnase inhibitor)